MFTSFKDLKIITRSSLSRLMINSRSGNLRLELSLNKYTTITILLSKMAMKCSIRETFTSFKDLEIIAKKPHWLVRTREWECLH